MSIEAVRPSEAQFRALIEHSTDALALLTRDGSIAYASPSMGRVTGYEAGELEGMHGLSLVHPDDQEQVQAALTSIRNQPGASITITYRLRLREGTFRWMEGTISNWLADPAIGAMVANYRDITTHEHIVQEREEARANALAAREATRRMDEFIGIASHELKTPLTSIKGNLQLARRRVAMAMDKVQGEDEGMLHTLEGIQVLLERAERQVGVQSRLVNDLVDLARIQTDQLELHLAMTDLATVVREVVEDQRIAAPPRLISFETAALAVRVRADSGRIGQVVSNYLSNALKYSPKDRPVAVRLTVQGELARVEVADEGPGLSAEQQARIWERFHRVPEIQVQSGSGVGLGLGLHICRMIIEQHQGAVGVQSTPGAGSIFWFTLPLGREHDNDPESSSR